MFREASIVLVLVLVPVLGAACGSFSEDGASPLPAGGDAGDDGGMPGTPDAGDGGGRETGGMDAGTCTPRGGPVRFFSAAFDDDSGATHYYLLGAQLMSPAPSAGTNVSYLAPATTLPYAMLINASGAPWPEYVLQGTQAVTKGVCNLHAELDVELKQPSLGSMDGALIAELGVRDDPGGFDHCYVTLVYTTVPAEQLILQSHCGSPDVYRHATVLPGRPTAGVYHHLKFDLALGEGRATIVYDNAQPVVLAMDAPATLRGGPVGHAAFGMGKPTAGTLEGFQLRFDSIVVDAR